MELKAQISKITSEAKESEQAEVESGENTGPTVVEADIANIVSQWTGLSICFQPYCWIHVSFCTEGHPYLQMSCMTIFIIIFFSSFQ